MQAVASRPVSVLRGQDLRRRLHRFEYPVPVYQAHTDADPIMAPRGLVEEMVEYNDVAGWIGEEGDFTLRLTVPVSEITYAGGQRGVMAAGSRTVRRRRIPGAGVTYEFR